MERRRFMLLWRRRFRQLTIIFIALCNRTGIGWTFRTTAFAGSRPWLLCSPIGGRTATGAIGSIAIRDGIGTRTIPGDGLHFIMDAGITLRAMAGSGYLTPLGEPVGFAG